MDQDKKQVQGIELGAIIDLKINGGMYSRLQDLLLHYSQQKPLEEFTKILQAVKNKESTDTYSYHLETLLVLINGIEEAASAQGKIKTADLPKQP